MKDDDEDQVKGKERKFLVNFARKFNKALKYRWEIIKLFLTFIVNIYYICVEMLYFAMKFLLTRMANNNKFS